MNDEPTPSQEIDDELPLLVWSDAPRKKIILKEEPAVTPVILQTPPADPDIFDFDHLETPAAPTPVVPTRAETIPERNISPASIPTAPKPLVRSFHSDMDFVMREGKGGTMARILEDARTQEKVKENTSALSKKNIIFLSLTFLFFIIGIAAVVYVILSNQPTIVPVAVVPTVPSLVRADDVTSIELAGSSAFKIETTLQQTILDRSLESQEIDHIYFTKNEQRTGLKETMDALGIELPLALQGSVSQNFMFGLYQAEKKSPFLILDVTSYDRAWTGMGEWEDTLLDDLKGLFVIEKSLLDPSVFTLPFQDELVLNQNLRVLEVPRIIEREELIPIVPIEENFVSEEVEEVTEGTSSETTTFIREIVRELGEETEPVLIYTFLDEQTLIIATSQETILEINKRLADGQIFK